MIALKKTPLVLALVLGLSAIGCGDDNNDSGNNNNNNTVDSGTSGNDAGGTTGGDGGAAAGTCSTGTYVGKTEAEIKANYVNAGSVCGGDGDIAGICELDPSGKAREVGVPCFLQYGKKENADENIRNCAKMGTPSKPGLTMTLTGMSDACVNCYVDAVICASNNCSSECLASEDACATCRDAKGCTEAFFNCAGLKPVE